MRIARSASRRTMSREHEPPTNPSMRPSANTIARSPRCELTGARRATTVATANDVRSRSNSARRAKNDIPLLRLRDRRRRQTRFDVGERRADHALRLRVDHAPADRRDPTAHRRAAFLVEHGAVTVARDVGSGVEVDDTAEAAAADLHVHARAAGLRVEHDVELELAAYGPDRDLHHDVERARVDDRRVDDVRHARRDVGGVADERPHRVERGRDLLPAAVFEVHAGAWASAERIARHTFSRVSGMSMCTTPSGASASITALTNAAGDPTFGLSPTPFAPIG